MRTRATAIALQRDDPYRRWGWLILSVVGITLLAACSGGGGTTALPKFDDAVQMDSAESPEESLDDLGFRAEDAEGRVYRTNSDIVDVYDYYANGVEDGWQVEQTIPDETEGIVILSKEDRIATVFVLPGYRAIEGQQLFADEGLDFDPDDVADDDTVILVSEFTCAEEDVEDCLGALR